MKTFGLIGFPLTHSFSKKYFEEKFENENITNVAFKNFSIEYIEQLKDILQTEENLKGFAVTIPHKRNVIQYLHKASDTVVKMNACNCIKIVNGKLHGYNTDVAGFEKSFLKHLKPFHSKALVLGTGGGASAVEYVLQKNQIEYLTVSRTQNIEQNILCYEDIDEKILSRFLIIINTTPLGMYPKTDAMPKLPYNFLTPQHYLFDLIYNPQKTKFLEEGEKKNATIVNGFEMLALQAEENWKIWNE